MSEILDKLKLSIDGKDGSFKLKDGYARFALAEDIHAQLGQFKSRFVFSAFSSDEKLGVYRRTVIGSAFGERDPGLQLDGKLGPFIAALQAQNGGDGAGDEWALTAKAIFAAIGKPLEKQEGGFGPDAETALTLGLGYLDDTTVSEGTALSAEAMLASGPLWAAAEVVDLGDDFREISAGPAKKAPDLAGGTPWTTTAALALDAKLELVGRFQDYDDAADTRSILGGINYYVNGHATKWQLNYSLTDSDDADLDGDPFTLCLVLTI